MIRAGTWGEKWDLWRATHIDPLQPTRVTPKNLNVSRLADVRSRVPFLDGASSDLDDAFAEGETSYSADGESVAESEPSVHRPTPRRSGTFITLRPNRTQSESDDSRSLVGYTPDLSLDFSPLGLDLRPVRTSTPISAQYHTPHKYDAGVAITPPPYSASVAHYDLTEDDSLLIQGLTTPKARKRELEEDRILEEEVLREMERRADQFYKTGLMGRCFDVWAQANDWVQVCEPLPPFVGLFLDADVFRKLQDRSILSERIYCYVNIYTNGELRKIEYYLYQIQQIDIVNSTFRHQHFQPGVDDTRMQNLIGGRKR